MDRMLDEVRSGPSYLRQPAIADMIVDALDYNENVLRHYVLHAFVIMPNHVHLLATPAISLPKLTRSLKGITAKRANAMLALTGSPFWQEEGYDHFVRNEREFEKIRNYIEENPVRAGLAKEASQYRWSSARTRGSALQRKFTAADEFEVLIGLVEHPAEAGGENHYANPELLAESSPF
jgi:putative DNA methylase